MVKFIPAKFYVATYGDMGLEVEFFNDREAHKCAIEEAEEQHKAGDLDSFTWGDCEVMARE